jgi:hypothetical protein
MNLHQQRILLTLVWFAGMLASAGVVLSYLGTAGGVAMLLWAEVTKVLQSVLAIYAVYLGGIIAFWFAKPFKVRRDRMRTQIRFWIAMIGTLILNGAYVANLSIGYWNSAVGLDDIIDARQLAWWLSFVVAPPNLYFFGLTEVASG